MKYPEATIQTKEYTARIERFCLRHRIDRQLLMRNTVVEKWMDEATQSMVIHMERRIAAGETVEETHSVQYPADWWQHLKQRWSPRWALKRWPVKMTTVMLPSKVTRMCPHLELRDEISHLRWLSYTPVPLDYGAAGTERPAPESDGRRNDR